MIVRAARFPGLYDKLIVDLFAGAGGAITGIEEAFCAAGIERYIDLAVNHDADAIACHELNHPYTEHRREDVWDIDPEAAVAGRQVGLLWASPDCTDFSKAKGGRPLRDVQRRSLAHVINRWAFAVRPDVIKLENVEEFRWWGLLNRRGLPLRDGRCFDAFVNSLIYMGYKVEWRELRACDYGTPTTRNRLFLVARCDGHPIVWPEKTHGEQDRNQTQRDGIRKGNGGNTENARREEGWAKELAANSGPRPDRARRGGVVGNPGGVGRAGWRRRPASSTGSSGPRQHGHDDLGQPDGVAGGQRSTLIPYRTAAECIDWSLPMCSVFATRPQAKVWAAGVNVGRAAAHDRQQRLPPGGAGTGRGQHHRRVRLGHPAGEATPGQAPSNHANTGASPVLITNPAIAVMFARDDELRRTIAEQLDLLARQGHPMRQPYACAACGMPEDHHHLPCNACGSTYFVPRFHQEHLS